MGVGSCTGTICEEKLQAVMLIIDVGESMADSSSFSALQDSITIEYPHWKEYKVTAWKQPLLITPKTDCTSQKQQTGSKKKLVDGHGVVGLQQVQWVCKYIFSHNSEQYTVHTHSGS